MKKILPLFILLITLSIAYSQTNLKTPYQKQIEKINVEFCRMIGIDEDLIQICKAANDFSLIFNSQEFSYKVHALGKEKSILAVLVFTESIKDAEKLKNEIDFKRDKEQFEKKEKEKAALELKIAEEKAKEELEEQENLKKEQFESSDFYKMKNNITKDIKNWFIKDEFEKTEHYNQRILQSKSAFDSIVLDVVTNSIKQKGNSINFQLLQYDADREIFPVEISYLDNSWIDSIKIPLNIAADFKNEFWKYRDKINNEDWIINNNNWIPTEISLVKYSSGFENQYNSLLLHILDSNNVDFYLDEKLLQISDKIDNYKFSWLAYVKNKKNEDAEREQKAKLEQLQKQEELKKQEDLKKKQEEELLALNALIAKYNQLKSSHTKNISDIKNKFLSEEIKSKKSDLLLDKFLKLKDDFIDKINAVNDYKLKNDKFIELKTFENIILNLSDKKKIKELADILENISDINSIKEVFLNTK